MVESVISVIHNPTCVVLFSVGAYKGLLPLFQPWLLGARSLDKSVCLSEWLLPSKKNENSNAHFLVFRNEVASTDTAAEALERNVI